MPDDSIASPWEHRKQQQAQRPPLSLQESIDRAVAQGYRVVSQTPTTAQLVKPKDFNGGWMLAWTLFSFGFLFWVYPLYYLSKHDEQLYLQSPPPVLVDSRWISADGRWVWNGQSWQQA